MSQSQGIFDDLVVSGNRIDLGANAPGQSPSITTGIGAPVANEATGSIYYRKDAPNAALMLYIRTASAWWPISATAFSSVSVNTEAALMAFDASALPDGAAAWVGNPAGGVGQSQDSTWNIITQVAGVPALSAHEVIASSVVGRVWQRRTNAYNEKWAQQATWFIDTTNGDDQSDGSTNVTALATWAEFARRMPYVVRSLTITILTSLGANDPISWTPIVRWNKALQAGMPTVTINGTATQAAPGGGANGVINVATQTVANVAPSYTDTAGAGVTFTQGQVVRITATGVFATIMKDLGGGTARVTPWYTAGLALAAAPVNGQAYTIESYTTAPDLDVSGEIAVTFNKMHFLAWTSPRRVGGGLNFFNVVFDTVSFSSTNTDGFGKILAIGIYFNTSTTMIFGAGSQIAFIAAGIRLVNASGDVRAYAGSHLTFLDAVFQGDGGGANVSGGLSCGSPNDNAPGGAIVISSNVGIFDTGNDNAINCKRGGVLEIFGTLYGSGNRLKGTVVRDGGHCFVKTGITPTLAATGQELELAGAATAIPSLAPGVAVPAASALTTWAQWAAGPFNRLVQDFAATSGAVIANHD